MATWNKNNTGKPVTTDQVRASVGVIQQRIDNLEKGLDGTDHLTAIDINGGSIDGTIIGGTTPSVGNFTQTNTDNIRIDGNTISSTNTDGDILVTPNGAGEFKVPSISTDGNVSLKFDIVTLTWPANLAAGFVFGIPHTKSTNLKGVAGAYCVKAGSGNDLNVWCDSSTVHLRNNGATISGNAGDPVIVDFVLIYT